jgi:ABC-type Fe3+ transport system permease subunit
MSNRVHCNCQRCRIRGLMGPTIVITVGVLFLLQQVRDSDLFGFSHTYPIILIVIGLISLASALAPTEGHIDAASTTPTSMPPAPPVPPPVVPPSPYQGQGQ